MKAIYKGKQQLEAWSYISKIRNKEKRKYALDFYWYITQSNKWVFSRKYVLGYMAKQAVQIRLNEILRGGTVGECDCGMLDMEAD